MNRLILLKRKSIKILKKLKKYKRKSRQVNYQKNNNESEKSNH